QGPTEFIRYTPSQQGAAYNSGAKQRIIRLVEAQVDPMEPPRFKINKKIPRGPPSPPAPVLHSPTRRVTVKEQKEWKIPPCISNWKNAKGYTVPLDKRLAADGRGLQQLHINENFAKLAEALYIADRKAREAVETRAQLEKKLAQKEKEQKEEHLRQLAQRARDERAGIRVAPSEKSADDEERERDMLRQDRHKERARERNLARAAPDKRSKLQRERERDISEQIA
nr:Bx42 [Cucujiformia]